MNTLTNNETNKKYAYLVSVIVALGGFNFGYDISIISGAIIFMNKTFHLNAIQFGFAMSSALIGCILGPFLSAAFSDKLGRKKALIIACILFGIGAIMTALAKNISAFYIFRFIGGVGIGLTSVVAPMYIAEISPARMRGRLVTLNQVAIVIGLLMAIIVSYCLSFSESWRWMFASESIPMILFLTGLFFVPESPRWLVGKNKPIEAEAILIRIDGTENAKTEMREITEVLTQETGTFSELFKPGIRMAMVIAIGLAFFQQITGASTVLIYAPTIFQKAGFENSSEAIFQSVIVASWLVICTVVSLWGVDRFGRKPLLFAGTIGMSVGMLLLGICFYFNLSGIYTLLIMMIVICAYSISLAPLAWLIMSEIFPTRIRGRAMAIASIVLWLTSFSVNQFFPPMLEYTKKYYGTEAHVFWLFSILSLIAFLFSWKIVPETKNKTLEEISKSWLKYKL